MNAQNGQKMAHVEFTIYLFSIFSIKMFNVLGM
jgi:hypothetical protein